MPPSYQQMRELSNSGYYAAVSVLEYAQRIFTPFGRFPQLILKLSFLPSFCAFSPESAFCNTKVIRFSCKHGGGSAIRIACICLLVGMTRKKGKEGCMYGHVETVNRQQSVRINKFSAKPFSMASDHSPGPRRLNRKIQETPAKRQSLAFPGYNLF